MIGGLLRLGGAALAGAGRFTGRTAVNTGRATGRLAKGGLLFGAGSMLGGASGAVQGGIGAVRSGTAVGAMRAGLGGNNGVSPVSVPLPDLSDKKELELLEIIAQNTGKTAKNTDLVNPPSAGGQALPPKDEDDIKKSFFDSKQMKDFNKSIGGLSATTVGLGVALAKLSQMRDKGLEEGDPKKDKISETFEAVRTPAMVASAALALPAAKVVTDKVGLTNRDPKGTVRDNKGTLRDAKTGQTVADPKSAAGQKRAAQETAKKAATRSATTRAAMTAARIGVRAVPVLGAATLVAEGAYMAGNYAIDKLGYRDEVDAASAKLISGTKEMLGMDEESKNRRKITQLQRRVNTFNRNSNPITSKLDPERKEDYITALKNAAAKGNEEMFEKVLDTMRKEARSGEQVANLSVLAGDTIPAVVPAPTAVAETVEAEIDNYTDATMAANKAAPIPMPRPDPPAAAAQEQDTIATTITVDRKAKDSTAEELKKINSIRIPAGF